MEKSKGRNYRLHGLPPHVIANKHFSLSRIRQQTKLAVASVGVVGLLFVSALGAGQTGADQSAVESERILTAIEKQYDIHLPSGKFTPQAVVAADLTNKLKGIIADSDKARAHLIVQLHRPPESEDRGRFTRQGLILLTPINRHTWRASVSAIGAEKIGRIEGVRWANVISPEDKLSQRAQLGTKPLAYQLRPSGRIAYSVLFHKDVGADEVQALSRRVDVELESFDAKAFQVFRTVTVTVPPGGITPLALADIVAWIEPVPSPDQPHNLLNAQPLSNVDMVQAAPINLDGTGVTVGVWEVGDTIYDGHLDLTPRVTVEAGQSADNDDHATHVAGTIGASGVNVGNAEGMAPNVDITSWDSRHDFSEMRDAATSQSNPGQPTPVQISNHSYGTTVGWNNGDDFFGHEDFGKYTLLTKAFDRVVTETGLIVVKSAGNDRNDAWDGVTTIPGVVVPPVPPNPPPPPGDCMQGGLGVAADCIGPRGSAKNVITVGAMTGAAGIAPFSSYGPTDDGRIKPDLMAHGFQLRSLACNCVDDIDPVDGVDDVPNSSISERDLSGTSMSTAVVTGIAALVLQDATGLNIDMAPARMKALLVQTAQDVDGVGPSTTGPDYSTGWGIVDAEAAITLLREGGITGGTLTDTGEAAAWTRPFSIPAGQAEVHVTLAWDDPSGTPGGQVLINDLDLRLIAPDNTVFKPWILDPDNPTATALRGNDAVNNVEQVSVDTPMAGVWTAQVSADAGNLSTSRQIFALAGPVGLTIVEPTESRPAWAGTSTDGNRVGVILVGAEDMDMSLANLSIAVGGVFLQQPKQIALHSIIDSETWLVINPGVKPVGCYDLRVSLIDMPAVVDTAPLSLCYEDAEGRMLDRVVVIDRTKSMEKANKMESARNAGQYFVEMTNDRDGIGVVSFQRTDEDGDGNIDDDELSEIEFPFTLAIDDHGNDRRQDALDAIETIAHGPSPRDRPQHTIGESSLGAGLLEAKAMLDAEARVDSKKIIVLVTDGRENCPPFWSSDCRFWYEESGPTLKADFKANNIRIDTVSIGLNAENAILHDMSDSTGGTPHNDLEGIGSFGLLSRLASTFKAIDEENRGEQRFYYHEGWPETPAHGEEWRNEEFFMVEEHLDWMTVAFHWNVDDAGVDLSLHDPQGNPVGTTRKSQKHAVYHVPSPAPGLWSYRVSVNNPNVEFFAVASGPTLLTARLRVGDTKLDYDDTWTTPLRVWIAEDSAVLGAKVEATIRRPDKRKFSVVLRDDESSADGFKGDGVYGAVINDTLSGPYSVDLVAAGIDSTGEPFERFMKGTFIIPGEPDVPGYEDLVTKLCGGSVWCCWIWIAFIVALIVSLVMIWRFWCYFRMEKYREFEYIAFFIILAITLLLGWWLLTYCTIALCWLLLTVALAVITAGLIACFTNLVPCMGWAT